MKIVLKRIERGDLPPIQQVKWQKLNDKINRLKTLRLSSLIDMNTYWNNIGTVCRSL